MTIKKKTIYIADHLFRKENFYNYNKYKKKFKIVFNNRGRPLNGNDLNFILKKNRDIHGIIAGLEKYNFKSLRNQKNLRVISRVGVGIDSLDQEFLKKKKIKILKLANELTDSVAELFVTLILVSLRKIIPNYSLLKKGYWKPIIGNNLKKKKIGIIGFGKIGKKLFNLLKMFNCKFYVFDKKIVNKNNIIQTSLLKIFSKCDVICVSLSLNKKTSEIINYKILRNAKNKIILINASRGGVINEKDLFSYFKKMKQSIAFLDCFNNEPYKGKLLKLKNIFSIPHIASYTHETRREMELSSSKKIISFLEKFD